MKQGREREGRNHRVNRGQEERGRKAKKRKKGR